MFIHGFYTSPHPVVECPADKSLIDHGEVKVLLRKLVMWSSHRCATNPPRTKKGREEAMILGVCMTITLKAYHLIIIKEKGAA